MKRLIADEGIVRVEAVAEPDLGDHYVRIWTEYSAISSGTEMMHLHNKSKHVPLGYSAVWSARLLPLPRALRSHWKRSFD